MESRVMGNCHARFGAGENLEERICSLRLHIPPKGLPIAIFRDGGGCNGVKAARTVLKTAVCRAEPPHGTVGKRIPAAISVSKYPCRYQKGL